MPSKNRYRLNDDECLFPALPGSGQENPEEAIELPEFRPPTSSVQNGELLAEREVLECQLRTHPQGGRDQRKQLEDHQDHAWEVSGPEAQKVNLINAAGVLAKDSSSSHPFWHVLYRSPRGRGVPPSSFHVVSGAIAIMLP